MMLLRLAVASLVLFAAPVAMAHPPWACAPDWDQHTAMLAKDFGLDPAVDITLDFNPPWPDPAAVIFVAPDTGEWAIYWMGPPDDVTQPPRACFLARGSGWRPLEWGDPS